MTARSCSSDGKSAALAMPEVAGSSPVRSSHHCFPVVERHRPQPVALALLAQMD